MQAPYDVNAVWWLCLLIALPVGAVLGSFATAIIHRELMGESWIFSNSKIKNYTPNLARSACPSCGHVLSFFDLIPLFSWFFLRGRCRYCRVGISVFYPLLELFSVLMCFFVLLLFGVSAKAFVLMAALPFLMSLFVIDFKQYILPDRIQYFLVLLGVVWQVVLFVDAPHDASLLSVLFYSFMSGCVYGGVIWGVGRLVSVVLRRDSLGFGDVKFFFMAGIWLGIDVFPAFLMLSGVAGVVLGIFWRYVFQGRVFPFGPALIVSFICLLCAQQVGLLHNMYEFFGFSVY